MDAETRIRELCGMFVSGDAGAVEELYRRDGGDDFRLCFRVEYDGGAVVLKLAENDFTSVEKLKVWQRGADEYRSLGYYSPRMLADADGRFPMVEFEGHRCAAWVEEYSKYRTAEEAGVDRASYWDDAMRMTAKVAALGLGFADFPSAYCLFETFCPSDKTDEVLENALDWKEYADTLPARFRAQVDGIWERWTANRRELERLYTRLPQVFFQADLNLKNILVDDDGGFVGVLDFNTSGRDTFLNYLFRENFHGTFDEERESILHALKIAGESYRFTDAEREIALPLYRCLKPLWFTRVEALKAAPDEAAVEKLLDETVCAQTMEIDFPAVMR